MTTPLQCVILASRSREGAWIEIIIYTGSQTSQHVAPVRERGLKFYAVHLIMQCKRSRSREGAWIEISKIFAFFDTKNVAPVRERGLK